MKRFLRFLLVVVLAICLTGCKGIKRMNPKKEEGEKMDYLVLVNKQNILPDYWEKVVELEEDKIWLDASTNAIYNQRITIKDSVMIHAKSKNSDFNSDISILESMKDTNSFANEFLRLLNDTNIIDVVSSGSDLEQYLLYSYLNIQINHYEGLGIYYNWVSDKYKNLNDYKLVKVYSKQFQGDRLIEEGSFKQPWFAFGFKDKNNQEVWVRTYGSISKSDNTYSTFTMYYYDSFDNLLLGESEISKAYEFNEVNNEIVDKIITNNNEFLQFYIKYKNEFYYPRFDEEKGIEGQWSNKENKKNEPKIGMTKSEVLNSSWGTPKKKNITETTYGKHEQWAYANGYIYFDDGVVTTIQKMSD